MFTYYHNLSDSLFVVLLGVLWMFDNNWIALLHVSSAERFEFEFCMED